MSNKIERIAVDSSMLNAVAYDEEEQILYAEFSNTGNIYYSVSKVYLYCVLVFFPLPTSFCLRQRRLTR